MLKPKYLDRLPDSMVELYSQAEMDILADMARRISAYDYFIPAAQWQYKKLIEMGNYHSYVVQTLSALTGKTKAEIEYLMQEAGQKALRFDDSIYRKAGLDPPPLSASPALQSVLITGIEKTNGLFQNLTLSTADTSTKQFENALDQAYMQITSGAFDYNAAIRNSIKGLAEKGLASVEYPTGRIEYIETAVRRAVITGVNQTALRLQNARADEMGCDLVETTAHAGARPSHAVWQGKVFSRSGTHPKYPDFKKSTGYGTGPGLGGWNCRHSFFPFYERLSQSAYDRQELAEMNAKTITYHGQKLTEYEASQRQRYIERQIRRWKREYIMMEAAGLPVDEAASKISKWQYVLKDFTEQTGLKQQIDREQIAGFTKSFARKAAVVERTEYKHLIKVLGEKNVPSSLEEFKQIKYYDKKKYSQLRKVFRIKISFMDFSKIEFLKGFLSDTDIRHWYDAHDKNIPNLIDKTKTIEEQARQAHALRNKYRTQARDLMRDQEARKELDRTKPNETFEQTVNRKMKEKNLTREEAIIDTLKTASQANKLINKKYGLED